MHTVHRCIQLIGAYSSSVRTGAYNSSVHTAHRCIQLIGDVQLGSLHHVVTAYFVSMRGPAGGGLAAADAG
eukprot:2430695-Pyramimonas_sp.AAC.1